MLDYINKNHSDETAFFHKKFIKITFVLSQNLIPKFGLYLFSSSDPIDNNLKKYLHSLLFNPKNLNAFQNP